MPVQCPKCKVLNRDTAAFCDGCGTSLILRADQTPSVGANLRPETLPEEQIKPDGLIRPAESPPQHLPFQANPLIRPPRAKPGSPRRFRGGYFLLAVAIGLTVDIFVAVSAEAAPEGVFFAAVVIIVCLPILFWRAAPAMGIVSHLREWTPQQQAGPKERPIVQNWLFDLRLTDQRGVAIADRKGFLLPIIEVEYRADRVHGPSLEEGSPVILRGKWKGERLRAVEIWNCSPVMQFPVLGEGDSFLGQVTQLQSSLAPDMRYPGQRSLQVLSFLLQPTDKQFQLLRDVQGNLSPSLPVEIRAQAISGPLHDGDKVELHGQVVNGILYTREVYNHSVGRAPVVVREWAGIS